MVGYENLLNEIGLTLLYFFIGLIVLLVGQKIFDFITPYKLIHELSEKDNRAVGVSHGGFYIGIGIIVHAALSGTSPSIIEGVISTISFFVLGLVLLSIGRKILDLMMPFDLDKEIVEDQNFAVGLIEAAFYVTIAILIHAAAS